MKTERPHITCLMMTSIDGKILGDNWGEDPDVKKLTKKYEEVHEKIGIKAWIVGRTTMEKDFTFFEKAMHKAGEHQLDRNDFVANAGADAYAIAVDGHAKLGWKNAVLHGDHVITILTEKVADSYLAHLRDIGVSYIFAGKSNLDLKLAMQKLYALFNIDALLLEGGGHLNGSFLDLGLVDEVYQVLLPLVDGTENISTFFDKAKADKQNAATLLKLEEVNKLEDDALLLRYTFNKAIKR